MPSPPSDGGTHPPPPWTDHSNDAVLRGGGGRGGGDGRGLPDSAIGAAGDRRGEVNFWFLVAVGGVCVDHACVIGGFDAFLFKLRAL